MNREMMILTGLVTKKFMIRLKASTGIWSKTKWARRLKLSMQQISMLRDMEVALACLIRVISLILPKRNTSIIPGILLIFRSKKILCSNSLQ
jgi:hypothetical protein